MSDANEEQQRVLAAAAAALSRAYGAPVSLGDAETLREQYRNLVFRCPVVDGPSGVPPSVIIKASVGDDENVYDPEQDTMGGIAWRFYNEWAGTRFLNALGSDPPHCAQLLAGDRAGGIVVLDDLGTGPSLADVVQGDDRQAAEAALRSYAAALGRLHAETVGRAEEWRNVRLATGSAEQTREREGIRWLRESIASFRAQCEALGVPVCSGFDEEAAMVAHTLDAPGPFDAFSPNDTCPDNHCLMPDGTLRFFDFEWAGFRHALLDAAYFRLPFPTCWCVNRLPAAMVTSMEETYRARLVPGCPAAEDDALFYSAMSHACASWTVSTVSWTLEEDLKEDQEWGIATRRQRHPLRLETFVETASRFGHLPAMSATAAALAAALRARWPPETAQMPLYPAFGAQDRLAPSEGATQSA